MIQKADLTEEQQNCKLFFDCFTNTFYSIKDTDGSKVDVFTIPDFKKVNAGSGFAKQFLVKRLQHFREQIYGEEVKEEEHQENFSKLNIIQRIMKDVSTSDLIEQSKQPKKKQFNA